MRDEDDRAAVPVEVEDPVDALALERCVADREDLVEQQDVGVQVRRDREAEPHEHPGRVGANRNVDEVLELRERDDLVEALADVRALQAEDRAVEEDVLAPGEVGMEAGAELEQRADPAADVDAAVGRLDDPGDDPQQRALARAVAADERERAAGVDLERDVAERPHVGRAGPAAQKDAALQRARAARVDAEAPRELADLDLTLAHESPAPAR